MKTILHIGLEKTGTTSVQQLLKANRTALLQQGTLISTSLHPGNNFYLAMASFSSFRVDGLLKQQGIQNQADLDSFRSKTLAKFQAELKSANGARQVLISSEHLQSRLTTISDIQLLKQNLESVGLVDFEVLVYLREPIRIALSHHGMAIKKGVFVDETFFEPNHPRVSQILGFQASIQMWQQVFGSESMRVRLYPEGQKPAALIDDFFDATALSQVGLNLNSEEKRNANLSAGALQILNDLNRENKLVANQVASKKFFDRLEKHVPGKGLSANSQTIEKFNEFYAASNEWVLKNFFAEQATLFEKPLAAGADATPEQADVIGVLSAALEVLEDRDRELTRLKSRMSLMPAGVKLLLKRALGR
jgi:hypothetical protein